MRSGETRLQVIAGEGGTTSGHSAQESWSSFPSSVSLVIPAHNEEASIAGTIRSCRAQSHPIEQIIVVADNCSDRTADIARSMGVVVIEGKGGSKASAQNMALSRITSDAVVALDADATLSVRAVEQMMDTLRRGYVGTCPSALPGDTSTPYSRYRTLYHAIANGWVRPCQDVFGRQLVLSGMANCHLTEVLRAVGGYPDDNITEDFNLTWTLHRLGHRVGFTPEAVVYTQEPTSLTELLSQMHRWTAGFAQTMVKHRAPMVDGGAFIVIVSQVVDSLAGGLATCTLLPYIARHGVVRGLRSWWSPLYFVVAAASVAVAVRQLGWRTTLRCLPSWLALQYVTGPLTAWWLFREWVLGRSLTTWTGRHGRRPALTAMTTRRKTVLISSGVLGALLGARAWRRRSAGQPSQQRWRR